MAPRRTVKPPLAPADPAVQPSIVGPVEQAPAGDTFIAMHNAMTAALAAAQHTANALAFSRPTGDAAAVAWEHNVKALRGHALVIAEIANSVGPTPPWETP